jgi:hypothetical protein
VAPRRSSDARRVLRAHAALRPAGPRRVRRVHDRPLQELPVRGRRPERDGDAPRATCRSPRTCPARSPPTWSSPTST